MRRLSAVAVGEVGEKEEATMSRAPFLSVVVLILLLPMVIMGVTKPCCCAREEGECVGVALLYFRISQLVNDSPQIWSRWM